MLSWADQVTMHTLDLIIMFNQRSNDAARFKVNQV